MNAFVRLWEVTKRGRVLAGDKYVLFCATLSLLAMANNANGGDWQERHQKWIRNLVVLLKQIWGLKLIQKISMLHDQTPEVAPSNYPMLRIFVL